MLGKQSQCLITFQTGENFGASRNQIIKLGEGRMKGEASVHKDSALEMQVLGEDRLEKRSAVLEVQRILMTNFKYIICFPFGKEFIDINELN